MGATRRFLLMASLAALAACGHGDELGSGSAQPASRDLLWETPPLPWPFELTVGGEPVPEDVVRGWLEPEWTRFCAARFAQGTPDANALGQAEQEFVSDPSALLETLVRGVILLQEAEARWPEIPGEDLEAFRAAFERDAAPVYRALLDEHGEDYLNAHLERRWRIRQLDESFAAALPAPTEEDLRQAHRELLEGQELNPEEQAALPTFETMRPFLQGVVEKTRLNEAIEAWIDERRPQLEAQVLLPDGRRVVLAPPGTG